MFKFSRCLKNANSQKEEKKSYESGGLMRAATLSHGNDDSMKVKKPLHI